MRVRHALSVRPMAVELLPEGLWELVQPFIPIAKAKPKGRRPRLASRYHNVSASGVILFGDR